MQEQLLWLQGLHFLVLSVDLSPMLTEAAGKFLLKVIHRVPWTQGWSSGMGICAQGVVPVLFGFPRDVIPPYKQQLLPL